MNGQFPYKKKGEAQKVQGRENECTVRQHDEGSRSCMNLLMNCGTTGLNRELHALYLAVEKQDVGLRQTVKTETSTRRERTGGIGTPRVPFVEKESGAKWEEALNVVQRQRGQSVVFNYAGGGGSLTCGQRPKEEMG